MTRNILLFMLLASFLISGRAQTVAPPTAAEPASEWTVRMTHSGGIMGLSRSIEISSNGKFTVTDEREDKTVGGELGAEEWSKLNELLTAVEKNAKWGGASPCADCFIYGLEIRGNGEKLSFHLDDTSLPASGCEPLVAYLRELMSAALD